MPSSLVKTCLVTGASLRIGRALALHMARQNYKVAIHYAGNRKAAQSLAKTICDKGGVACVFQADFTNHTAVENLVPRITKKLGSVSCLINNASVFEQDAIEDVSHKTWQQHQDINLRAPLFLTKALAQQLPKGHEGVVINILDQKVWRLTPSFLSYTVSKSGLWTLTQILAQALAPTVRVNAIGPGPTLTNIHQSEQTFQRQWKSTPLGRGAKVEEICAAVRFILNTPSMTGQMMALDGGQHLTWPQDLEMDSG